MIEKFPEFEDEEICSKCNTPGPDVKYEPQPDGTEALKWTCGRCGYQWLTQCADADAEEEEP